MPNVPLFRNQPWLGLNFLMSPRVAWTRLHQLYPPGKTNIRAAYSSHSSTTEALWPSKPGKYSGIPWQTSVSKAGENPRRQMEQQGPIFQQTRRPPQGRWQNHWENSQRCLKMLIRGPKQNFWFVQFNQTLTDRAQAECRVLLRIPGWVGNSLVWGGIRTAITKYSD